MSIKTELIEVSTKLAQLKVTLNEYAEDLTLEEYDHLHGDIEELQGLVSDVIVGVKEHNMDGGLGVDWVKAC